MLFYNSDIVFVVTPTSSGFVPDDYAEGHGVESIFVFDEVGLDYFFQFLFEVIL
jgi:hypothetical protein